MRFRLPADCAGVTHAGTMLARAADGTVEADAAAALALAPHGLVPIDPDGPPIKSPRDRQVPDDHRMLR